MTYLPWFYDAISLPILTENQYLLARYVCFRSLNGNLPLHPYSVTLCVVSPTLAMHAM